MACYTTSQCLEVQTGTWFTSLTTRMHMTASIAALTSEFCRRSTCSLAHPCMIIAHPACATAMLGCSLSVIGNACQTCESSCRVHVHQWFHRIAVLTAPPVQLASCRVELLGVAAMRVVQQRLNELHWRLYQLLHCQLQLIFHFCRRQRDDLRST